MYTPTFRVKRNGVPILSKKEISAIGENLVRDFQPEAIDNPAPVDIEFFIEFYLRLKTDYRCLSNNGIYLGMTVFNDTNRVVIYSPVTQRAEYFHASARTVIIDPLLLEEKQKHRLRFTLGHEGAHDILHSAYFSVDAGQMRLFGDSFEPMIQCRMDSTVQRKDYNIWNDHDWMEWQANCLSSSILMPERAVRIVAERCRKQTGLDPDTPAGKNSLVKKLVKTFDVSSEAAEYRLRDLEIIPKIDRSYVVGSAFPELIELTRA